MAGSVDGTVRRFDARAGCLFTDDLGQSVTSIAISGDNLCVLAACLDGHMRLLDKATGTMLAQYKGRDFTEHSLLESFGRIGAERIAGCINAAWALCKQWLATPF